MPILFSNSNSSRSDGTRLDCSKIEVTVVGSCKSERKS